jgi:hypothetical protein
LATTAAAQTANRYDPRYRPCVEDSYKLTTTGPDKRDPWWQVRDWITRALPSDVPLISGMGLTDGNVRLNSYLDFWNGFTGPRYGWFGYYWHEPPQADEMTLEGWSKVGRTGFLAEQTAFFDAYVKGLGVRASGLAAYPNVTVGEGHGAWRGEHTWPIEDATMRLPLAPGSYVDAPVSASENQTIEGGVPVMPPVFHGQGAWTVTPTLDDDVHLTGSPRLDVRLSHPLPVGVTVVATLFEITPDGRALPASRSVADLQPTDGGASFALYPVDWKFPAGSRIGLLLAGSDLRWWFTPGHSGQTVTVVGGALDLPLERCPEGPALDGGPSAAFEGLQPIDVSQRTDLATSTPTVTRVPGCGRADS